MAYLVPDADSTGTAVTFGAGTGQWDRLNSYGTPDDSNGIVWDNFAAVSILVVRLSDPSVGVDEGQPIALKVRAGGFTKYSDPGDVTMGMSASLYKGDPYVAGLLIKTLAFSRGQDEAFSESSIALDAGDIEDVDGDWGNMFVEFHAPTYSGSSGSIDLKVSELALEYTETGGGGGARRRLLPLVGCG